jgi:hypothetical protein
MRCRDLVAIADEVNACNRANKDFSSQFLKSSSIRAKIESHQARLQELRANFTVCRFRSVLPADSNSGEALDRGSDSFRRQCSSREYEPDGSEHPAYPPRCPLQADAYCEQKIHRS